MFFRALCLLIAFISSAHADYFVCIEPDNAELVECSSTENRVLDQICNEKHGEEFKSYFKSNDCTDIVAAQLRGESSNPSKVEAIMSPCYSKENGSKKGCQLWSYTPAHNFCSHVFGPEFLPFEPKGNCSYENALKEAGFKDTESLIVGLESKVKQIDSLLSLIDRNGPVSDFRERSSFRPLTGVNFYGVEIQNIIRDLKELKTLLENRSFYKVVFLGDDPNIIQFVYYLKKYLQFQGRINQLYAYYAHENKSFLETYNLDKLEFLNLSLHRIFALEVLSKISLNAQTVNAQEIRLSFTEATKQHYEYNALSEPRNKIEYADLVKFLGIRENLINYWSVRNISPEKIPLKLERCDEYLSLKADNQDALINKESDQYDLYYSGFIPALEEIKKNNNLAGFSTSLFEVILPKLKLILNRTALLSNQSDRVDSLLNSYLDIIEEIESDSHKYLFENHLKTKVLVGDNLTQIEPLADLISNEIVNYKLKIFTNSMKDFFNIFDKEARERIVNEAIDSVNQNWIDAYKEEVRDEVLKVLLSKLNPENIKEKNLKELLSKNIQLSQKYARDAYALNEIVHGRSLEIKPRNFREIEPIIIEKLADEFVDITYSIKHNKSYNDIFTMIMEKVKSFESKEKDFRQIEKGFDTFLIQQLEKLADEENLLDALTLFKSKDVGPIAQKTLSMHDYQTMVYDDGEPVVLHIDQLYQSLVKPFEVKVPLTHGGLSLNPMWGVTKPIDYQIKDFSIDEYIGIRRLNKEDILRLYRESLAETKALIKMNKEQKRILKIEKEKVEDERIVSEYGSNFFYRNLKYVYDLLTIGDSKVAQASKVSEARRNKLEYEKNLVLRNKTQFMFRLFKLFNIVGPITAMPKNENEIIYSNKEIKKILKNRLEIVYGQSPLLRIKTEQQNPDVIFEQNKRVAHSVLYSKINIVKEMSLLRQIAKYAYEPNLNLVDKKNASLLIKNTINFSKEKVIDTFNKFCQADIRSFEGDDNFYKAFHSSHVLRTSLKSNKGTTAINAENIKKFDDELRKDMRGSLEAVNEDYIEPSLIYIGVATLGAFLVVGTIFTAGSLGLTIPGILTSIGALSTAGLASLKINILLFAIFTASTTARLNASLFVVPKQLSFNKQVIESQIGQGKIMDYKTLDQLKKSNAEMRGITLLFLPLDILFGKSLATQIKSRLGFTGVEAFKNLTGVKLNKYSYYSFKQQNGKKGSIQVKHDLLSNIANKSESLKRAIKTKLPKYQNVPQAMFGLSTLRVGLINKYRTVKMNQNAGLIFKHLRKYSNGFFDRFEIHSINLRRNFELEESLILNEKMKIGELFTYGLKYSGFVIRTKAEIKSILNGTFFELKKKYGDLLIKIKQLQAHALEQKYKTLVSLNQKVEKSNKLLQKNFSDEEVFEQFIHSLNKDELILLGKMSKKIPELAPFKKVFSDYNEIHMNLQSSSYLYGELASQSFSKSNSYDDLILKDHQSNFNSPYEDIKSYYEAVSKQLHYNIDNEELLLIKEIIEIELGDLSRLN